MSLNSLDLIENEFKILINEVKKKHPNIKEVPLSILTPSFSN